MEKSLEKHMVNTSNNHGVTGIICVDQNGLCLGAKGNIDPKTSGLLAAITKDAENILPGYETPVISIEYTNSNIMVKSKDGYTTAISKLA